jgi:hypothetical protein
MPLTLRVHEYTRVPGTQDMRLVKTSPYVRLAHGGAPPVYVQDGRAHSEGGPVLDAIPGWLPDELKKLTPGVLAETGGDRLLASLTAVGPSVATASVVGPRTVMPIREWTCPEPLCGETMPARAKGFHVAKHRRQERRTADGHGER